METNETTFSRRGFLITLGAAAIPIVVCLGAFVHSEIEAKKTREFRERGEKIESQRRRARSLEEKIKSITGYESYAGSNGLTYQEFVEATGMKKELPAKYDSYQVRAHVYIDNDRQVFFHTDSNHQRVDTEYRKINILLPCEDASKILSGLQKYQNKKLGIEEKPRDYIDGFP